MKFLTIIAALLCAAACATSPPTARSEAEAPQLFVYDDLDAFAASIQAIDAGADVGAEMQRYTENASPAFQFFAGRFGATAESMTQQVTRRPLYYRYLTTLTPELQALEPQLRRAMDALLETAPPGSQAVPIYFLVGNQTAGGNPGSAETPQGTLYFVAVAIDVMSISPRVDLSEFPNGTGGRVQLTDLPYVIVHETAHVFQRQFQGLDNYRSIYIVEERGTNLAYAIREGCADFLTELASGWVLEPRHSYVNAHEAELWAAFEPIMRAREDGASGWFGAPSAEHPERPSQVGYGVGARICRAYYEAAADKDAALLAIYGAYLPEHFEAIVAPYAARMRGG